MAKTCLSCNRYKMKDSPYCFYHNPDIPESEKKAANAKGGFHTRVIPHGLKSSDILPIDNPQDLKNFLNVLLSKSIDEIEDTSQMIKISLPIVDKLSEIFQIELLEEMQQRIKIIEAKQEGKLLEAGDYATTDN